MSIKKAKNVLRLVTIGFFTLLLVVCLLGSFYNVEEQEQAVVMTYGTASVVATPGLHFKLPFIQKVTKVSTTITGMSIGYDKEGNWVPTEALMITSDFNFVNVDFYIEYRVSNPEKFLFASAAPEVILKNLALSYIRDTVGMHTVDEVITTGKADIQAAIREKLANRLEAEDIGLQLININIQDAQPPTSTVIQAFTDVENAKQDKETVINEAYKYRNEKEPAARADVDAILRKAESTKASRIASAQGQIASFNAMYEEYKLNPDMTRQRMFYEAMEELLPHITIVIDNGDGTTYKVLPLDAIMGQTAQGGA